MELARRDARSAVAHGRGDRTRSCVVGARWEVARSIVGLLAEARYQVALAVAEADAVEETRSLVDDDGLCILVPAKSKDGKSETGERGEQDSRQRTSA